MIKKKSRPIGIFKGGNYKNYNRELEIAIGRDFPRSSSLFLMEKETGTKFSTSPESYSVRPEKLENSTYFYEIHEYFVRDGFREKVHPPVGGNWFSPARVSCPQAGSVTGLSFVHFSAQWIVH
jgi:hypothetical protein